MTHDEDFSTVDDATGGDEDPTENVENVQLGEKEKVTFHCALEDHECYAIENFIYIII